MFYLPRLLWRHNFGKIFRVVKDTPIEYYTRLLGLKMDRIERILTADKDIEQKIMALRCEVGDMEAQILDNFLIERLKKENSELEQEIEKYRNELIQLEKLNGRTQVVSCSQNSLSSVNTIPSMKDQKQSKELSPQDKCTPSKASSQEKSEKYSSKTPEKTDSKKAEKTHIKKAETVNPKNPAEDESQIDIGRLDLRVGKIKHIEKHPNADSLYVEKVDIGKPNDITVVSGLVKHISADEMLDSLVIILCNLKPAKMRGITSEGMVMCASTEGTVEVLRPPPSALPGDIITCSGYNSNPDPVMNPKKKIFETVAPDLKTDGNMVATYKGVPWTVGSKGVITAQTLKEANIK